MHNEAPSAGFYQDITQIHVSVSRFHISRRIPREKHQDMKRNFSQIHLICDSQVHTLALISFPLPWQITELSYCSTQAKPTTATINSIPDFHISRRYF